jgi:hypothetical protein
MIRLAILVIASLVSASLADEGRSFFDDNVLDPASRGVRRPRPRPLKCAWGHGVGRAQEFRHVSCPIDEHRDSPSTIRAGCATYVQKPCVEPSYDMKAMAIKEYDVDGNRIDSCDNYWPQFLTWSRYIKCDDGSYSEWTLCVQCQSCSLNPAWTVCAK